MRLRRISRPSSRRTASIAVLCSVLSLLHPPLASAFGGKNSRGTSAEQAPSPSPPAGATQATRSLASAPAQAAPQAQKPSAAAASDPNALAYERTRKEDPEKECPFASKNAQFASFREQIRSLSGQAMTQDSQTNPNCARLLNTFKSNSQTYLSMTTFLDADPETGIRRKITPEEARARAMAADSFASLLGAGCTLGTPSKTLESGLMMMDALGGGVMATGVITPQNFVLGAGISAASRLGLALAQLFRHEKPEYQKLRAEMKNDAFRDQLCLFRNIYYRLDKLDPDPNTATRRLAEIDQKLQQNREEMAKLQDACTPETDEVITQANAWFGGIKAKLDAAIAAKEDSQRCRELKYLVDEQRARLEDVALKLDCESGTGSIRTKEYCAAWSLVARAMASPERLCFPGSGEQTQANAEFQENAKFVLSTATTVLTAHAQAAAQTPGGDAYGKLLQLRAATAALESEAKALRDPNLILGEHDRAQANEMVRELGKLLIRDGFTEYNAFNRKTMAKDYDLARDALKRRGDQCQNAQQAWDQIRSVRPRMNAIQQICTTLGADGPPIPPLRDPSRNFNTVTGEESRRGSGVLSRTSLSPLQQNCRIKPDPSPRELESLESKVVDAWRKNCSPDLPAPR